MGQCTWWRGILVVDAFSASFILLLKIRRSSSMSEKPAGGAFLLEAWRIAGILKETSRRRNYYLEIFPSSYRSEHACEVV